MFVGRTKELNQLKQATTRDKPTISVIYGRRRIGKSELIREALKDRGALFFEGLESAPKKEQIAHFMYQLRRQTPHVDEPEGVASWREAFDLLEKVVRQQPRCIVFDEFQWMARYRKEIVSILKAFWDQYLSRIPGVHLVLCGSVASFMISNVIRSNALYGRTDLVIHLKGFSLLETAQMLGNRGTDEILEAQMLVGGVPKYLELLAAAPSVHLGMEELAFNENGYFVNEYHRIFTSHFGRNRLYRQIIETLAAHPYGLLRAELARKLGIERGGGLSKLLNNLESAGFISSVVPFHKPRKSRLIKYFLYDAYLRFYFAFIVPNIKKIESGAHQNLFGQVSQSNSFRAWRGRAFEYTCMDHVPLLADVLGFRAVSFEHGPFFSSPTSTLAGVQIDLLFDRADNVLTLCEMKCSKTPIGKSIIPEVEKKVQVLGQIAPSKTVQRVLIVNGQITNDLETSGYFFDIIHAHDLIRLGSISRP